MAFLKTGDGGGSTPNFDHYEYPITDARTEVPWGTFYRYMAMPSFGKTYNHIYSIEASYMPTSGTGTAFTSISDHTMSSVNVLIIRNTVDTISGVLSINVYGD